MTETRPSLQKTLEERYKSQQAGGAFNAKEITTEGHASLEKDGKASIQSAKWTPKGFKTRMMSLLTEFNGKALGFANYLGVDTRRYK
jgi:hypothetical protein